MAKYDFFISYSSKDEEIAFNIVNAIESAGYTCWIAPRNIPYGTPYASAIMEGIDGCDKFLVLITKNSVKSRDVLNEVDNAHSAKKTIIPVRLTDTELPRELNYYLSRTQWLTIPASNPEEIVKLLNIGGVAPVPPNPVPPRPIKRMLVFAIAAIIAIGAGVAIWWFTKDKSIDINENSALAFDVVSDSASVADSVIFAEQSAQSKLVDNEPVKKDRTEPTQRETVTAQASSGEYQKLEEMAKNAEAKGKFAEALQIYIKIAKTYDIKYAHKVGWMYHYGRGTFQNLDSAKYWYDKAPEEFTGVRKYKGRLYVDIAAKYMEDGKYKEAAQNYESAEKLGYLPPICKYWLGHLYYTGQGVTKDLKKAKDYWEQAASEGDKKAKADLEKYFKE